MEYETQDPILIRFFNKVEKDPDSDCWIWKGSINRTGYGEFSYNSNTVIASRFIYIALKCDYEWLDKSIVIKHSCDRKSCVNINHLSAGTSGENQKEAYDRGLRIKNSDKPYCKHGHLRSVSDFIDSRGYPRCRKCTTQYKRRYRMRQKELVNS